MTKCTGANSKKPNLYRGLESFSCFPLFYIQGPLFSFPVMLFAVKFKKITNISPSTIIVELVQKKTKLCIWIKKEANAQRNNKQENKQINEQASVQTKAKSSKILNLLN